jgi:hypothetical protein
MAYNRKNLLRKIIAVQKVYQTHKIHEGITDEYIYQTHIKPVFHISKRTFIKYLGMRAAHELKNLLDANPDRYKQTTLW